MPVFPGFLEIIRVVIIKITVKTVFFTEKFGDHGGKT